MTHHSVFDTSVARVYRTGRWVILIGGLLGWVALASARGEDWPRFGGPRGDSTWQGPRGLAKFPAEGLRTRFRKPIGAGYGGISVVGPRLYVADRQTDPTERERVLCFDAATGEPIWTRDTPCQYGKLDYGNGPRATPTVHGERLFVQGAVGHMLCLDAKTGDVRWSHDGVRDLGVRVPEWGLAASPVVYKKLVLFHGGVAGGCLIAFDTETGAERWRVGNDPAGYATPIVIDAPSGPQVICWSPEHILGVDPESGKLLWKVPYKVTYGVSIATPIFQKETVLVSGYWEGAKAIRLGPQPDEAKLAWEESKLLRGLMAQPLYRDGFVYLLDRGLGLTCFELETGKKRWDDAHQATPRGRNPHVSLTWVGEGDRALLLNAEGELILARLNPTQYSEEARTKIIEPTRRNKIWAHPAFAGNTVYARSDEELVAVELSVEK